jgi:ferrous iron transport protein A
MKTKDITQMNPGEKGVIINIYGGIGLLKKLDALGIRVGVEITKVSAQLFRGPVTIQVGNTQVAIGYGMAKKIIVSLQSTVNSPQKKERNGI